jgi:hypothetical protein
MTPTIEFSFCEAQPPSGKWHIRKLTAEGHKPGGGIDTASLCKRVKPRRGWDLLAPMSATYLRENTCPDCRSLYQVERG